MPHLLSSHTCTLLRKHPMPPTFQASAVLPSLCYCSCVDYSCSIHQKKILNRYKCLLKRKTAVRANPSKTGRSSKVWTEQLSQMNVLEISQKITSKAMSKCQIKYQICQIPIVRPCKIRTKLTVLLLSMATSHYKTTRSHSFSGLSSLGPVTKG